MAKKKTDCKTIREAVIRNHGGFDKATNSQIMELWKSLDEDTRRRYLGETETRNEVANADSV